MGSAAPTRTHPWHPSLAAAHGSVPPHPSDTLYFFGDNNFTEWGSLFQHYVPPPFRIPGTSGAYSFGIAGVCRAGCGVRAAQGWHSTRFPPIGSGSGVPFHWHGPGYSEVIFGRKVSTSQ